MKKCPEGTKKIHHAMDKEFRAPMEIRRIYHAQWKPASSPAEFKVTWQYDDKYGPTEELKLKSPNRLRMMRNRQTREASSIGKAPLEQQVLKLPLTWDFQENQISSSLALQDLKFRLRGVAQSSDVA